MEKNISYRVQHQCPQCGAPVLLEESGRFFTCPFCRVASCISQKGYFRYMFSPSENVPADARIFYVPYWRFKGTLFFCSLEKGVGHRFMDLSQLAVGVHEALFPASLGLRSQALPLRLVSETTPGVFIAPMDFDQAMEMMDARPLPGGESEPPLCREYIGETASLVFAPFYIDRGRLMDAVRNEPTGAKFPDEAGIDSLKTCRPARETIFIAGLCPACGWNLEGETDSLILACRNCNSLWQPAGKSLLPVVFECATAKPENTLFLPFWRMDADISGLPLTSYADLVKIVNLPKAIRPEWKDLPVTFWAPAFKLRPSLFLRVSQQLLLAQPGPETVQNLGGLSLYPITLPANEAVESLRTVIASVVRPAKRWMPEMARAAITARNSTLVYLPFEQGHHDLFYREHKINIEKNTLVLSTNL